MCFSLEASFAAATALVPVGAYCVSRAVQKDLRFLPLACMPVAFAVQQAAEGCVWYGLDHENQWLVHWSAASFLFFALAFWPFWIPFTLLFVERSRAAKVFLGVTAALNLSWLGFYVQAAVGPDRELHAHVVHHSIDYGLASLRGFRDLPLLAWQLVYLACICGPLLLSRTCIANARWRYYGGVIAVLFVVSDLVYWYAFASVWCFFAAVSSVMLALAFAKLPSRAREPTRATPGSAASAVLNPTVPLPK